MTRQYSEYSELFSTQREDDRYADLPQRESTQPADRKRRAGGRSAVKWITDGTVLGRDNQWDIPRKCALFISDGPDSTTSGSDILEGHYDRPAEEEYSDIPKSG